jgi:hypothetical protein
MLMQDTISKGFALLLGAVFGRIPAGISFYSYFCYFSY